MQFTRKQIIEYLRKHNTASAQTLSRNLSLTRGNIRHHLKELKAQRVIEEAGTLPAEGRGRPTKLYGLSVEAQNNNMVGFSEALLHTFLRNDRFRDLDLEIAQEMLGDYEPHINPVQRLNQTIAWLNQRHYHSRWEAWTTGPRVIIEHCPYALLGDHPEICQIDSRLLTLLTGVSLRQVSKRKQNSPGLQQCIFTV